MSQLSSRITKFQNKQKQQTRQEFLIHKLSRKSLVYNKQKNLITPLAPSERVQNLISHKTFFEKRDILTDYAINDDPSKPFFDHYLQLQQNIPYPNTIQHGENPNCSFADSVLNAKDCYLSSTIIKDCSNIAYSFDIRYNCHNIFNSAYIYNHSDSIYNSFNVQQSFNVFYSKHINNSSNIRFSSNCIGCQHCLFCNDLENTSYAYKNQIVGKEQYLIIKEKMIENKNLFFERYTQIITTGNNLNSTNISGTAIIQSTEIKKSHCIYNVQRASNCLFGGSHLTNEDYFNSFLLGRCTSCYGVHES